MPGLELTKEQILASLGDRWWRLNNLYRIKSEGRQVIFRLNQHQSYLYHGLHYRNTILKARQLGFTTALDIMALDMALFNSNFNVGIIAHTQKDATAIFEEKIRTPYDELPAEVKALRPLKKDAAGELRFGNNSNIRVGISFRSGSLDFLHVSELGKLAAKYPERAIEVKSGALPTVHINGLVFYESTAEGASGYFYETCKEAQDHEKLGKEHHNLSFKFWFFPWWKEPKYSLNPEVVVIPQRLREYFHKLRRSSGIELRPEQMAWYTAMEKSQGSTMKREYPSTPQEAFEQAIEGAYYARQFEKIYEQGRICSVPHEPGIPVHTSWDLGMDDSMTIWFFQNCGREIHLIDYYENSGEGLAHYADVLRSKAEENGYKYGTHHMPHDIAVRELGTGKSREESAIEYGIKPIERAPNIGLADGIEAVRRILPLCWFDEEKTEKGVRALEGYSKEWDQANGVYKNKPKHNWASHGADSFRVMAVGHEFDNSITAGSEGGGFNPNLPDYADDGLYREAI